MTTAKTVEHTLPLTQLGTDRPSRHTNGDIDSLATSMVLEGLRHPVLLLPSGEILKGTRRVAAARFLGWSSIQVRTVITIEEAAEAIIAQRDETSHPRKISEWVDLGTSMEQLDRRTPLPPRGSPTYDINAVVGPAVTTSGSQYRRGKLIVLAARSQTRPAHVVDVAQTALEQIEAGDIVVTTGYNMVRVAEKADPIDGLGADGLPVIPAPLGTARSPKARKLRIDWIRALVAKGATSQQISDQLGISVPGLKRICESVGIVISADVALNRTQRKAADPNRAVRVALTDLDALVWSLDKVDPTVLDPDEASAWAQQLKEYARSIDRVSRKIAKEHVR